MTITLPALALLAALGTHPHAPAPSAPSQRPIWTSAVVLSHHLVLQQGLPGPVQSPSMRTGRRVSTIVYGALAGAVGGAAIGYLTTHDCRCDDPGYGAVLGLPIGAVGGAIVGALIR